jgi:hypothetical protein
MIKDVELSRERHFERHASSTVALIFIQHFFSRV